MIDCIALASDRAQFGCACAAELDRHARLGRHTALGAQLPPSVERGAFQDSQPPVIGDICGWRIDVGGDREVEGRHDARQLQVPLSHRVADISGACDRSLQRTAHIRQQRWHSHRCGNLGGVTRGSYTGWFSGASGRKAFGLQHSP